MNTQELYQEVVAALEVTLKKGEDFGFRLQQWLQARKEQVAEEMAPTLDDDFDAKCVPERKETVRLEQMTPIERIKHSIEKLKESK
jgi:hypothetical protein